jgi:hypothetical protein
MLLQVSGAGSPEVNGVYTLDTANLMDSVPSYKHSGGVLTLLRYMFSQTEGPSARSCAFVLLPRFDCSPAAFAVLCAAHYWYISDLQSSATPADDVDDFRAESAGDNPPHFGWATFKAGSDPAPTLRCLQPTAPTAAAAFVPFAAGAAGGFRPSR